MGNYLKVFLGIALIIFAYLLFSSPGEIVVNEAAEIKDLTNKTRAILQGKHFWKDQIREINYQLQMHLSEPRRREESRREMHQLIEKLNRSWEEFYRKHPDKQPSPTQQQAEALRKRAAQLERDEFMLLLERERLERIEKLGRILASIKARAE